MKFYRHDPDAWLAGTSELSFEQCGAYIKLINLLYSRDGMVPDDDGMVARMMQCDPRTWRKLKRQLITANKVRVTTDGRLTANGVDRTRLQANLRSNLARHQANVRWENYRKAKQNNDPVIQHCNTTISNKIYKTELLSESEKAEPPTVDNKENQNGAEPETTTKSIATRELAAIVKSKWLGR